MVSEFTRSTSSFGRVRKFRHEIDYKSNNRRLVYDYNEDLEVFIILEAYGDVSYSIIFSNNIFLNSLNSVIYIGGLLPKHSHASSMTSN